jgi:hypothetical protein
VPPLAPTPRTGAAPPESPAPSQDARARIESCGNEQLSSMLRRRAALGWPPEVYEIIEQTLRNRQVPVSEIQPKEAPRPQVAPAVPPPPTPRPQRRLGRAGQKRPRLAAPILELAVPAGDALCVPLTEAAHPQVYRTNAFRVTGLAVDATAREISRQAEKLRMMEKLGAAGAATAGVLALEPAPDPDGVREAIQRLGDPERRLVDELFWLWPVGPAEASRDEALQALVRGEADAAIERWLALESSGADGRIATHNLAVVHHARALDLEHHAAERGLLPEERQERDECWEETLPRWRIVAAHDPFWERVKDRVRTLDDPRLTAGTLRRMRASLPLALLLVDARLALRAAERGDRAETERHRNRLVGYGFGAALVDDVLRRAVAPVGEQIQQLCRSAEPKADADPARADQVARELTRQTSSALRTIDLLLPDGHPSRVGAHDEVALRALACLITFGNKTENWAATLGILRTILPIAASSSAKGRVEQNIATVDGNIQLGTCWFCQKRPAEDPAAVGVDMYGNVVRVPVWNGVQVQWQKVKLQVPRCRECKGRHGRAGGLQALTAGAGLALGGSLVICSGGHWAGFLFGAIFVTAGFVGGAMVKGRVMEGIRDLAYRTSFPTVKDKISEGWKFGTGPSG